MEFKRLSLVELALKTCNRVKIMCFFFYIISYESVTSKEVPEVMDEGTD